MDVVGVEGQQILVQVQQSVIAQITMEAMNPLVKQVQDVHGYLNIRFPKTHS